MPAAPLQPPLSAPASYAPPVYPAAPQPPVNTPYTQQPYAQPYSPPPPVNTPPYSYYSPQQPGYTPVQLMRTRLFPTGKTTAWR